MWGCGETREGIADAACTADPTHCRRLAAGGSLNERKVAMHSKGVGRHRLDKHREHPHVALQAQAKDI